MQMMVTFMKNIIGVGAQKIGASTLHALHLQNVLPVLASTSAEGTVDVGGLLSPITSLIEGVWGLIISWFYFISKFVFQIVDLIQYLLYKLAGINLSSEMTFDLPIYRVLLSETILKIFISLFVIGLILLIALTIISIVKSEYSIAVGLETDPKKVKGASSKVVKSTLTASILMFVVPFLVIVSLAFGSVFLTSINSLLNPNGTSGTTLGGQVFVASAQKANKYRIYADNNQRIPILYNFYDPMTNGTAQNYTEEELEREYADWANGSKYYSDQRSKNYNSFSSTLVYKNNRLYNKADTFGDYEQWVSTPEQYYIMADFIDYAVKNNLEFYIKDSSDNNIDWTNMSSEIKLSDGVYDPATGTFKLSYKDISNVNKYEDVYNMVLDANEFIASSPIADTTKTIAELLSIALNEEDIEDTKSRMFRMLERVEGSTNIVKWKTEYIAYGQDTFSIYQLTKRYFNPLTGRVEARATVPVARKQSAGSYYILKQNGNGNYEYTNQVIEYNNDGKLYRDQLEPVYVYGNWPEKLYNDLKVIYDDINIDNYINYDNWADMLGEYYTVGENISSDQVVTFATTLIHPLGLIMSELFLGVTFESDNQITDISFTSQYLEETIQALCFAVGGEEKYWQLKCEIESFVDMFNGLFTPIVEELQKIEGFDLYDEDEYSVQGYVYKAYLASIMLSDSANDYFETLGYEILNLNNLAAVIYNNTTNYVYDSNGDIVYKVVYSTDEDGNKIQKTYTSTKENGFGNVTGKYVYNQSGELVVVCDNKGVASETSQYVPMGGIFKDNVKFDEENGIYRIKYDKKFYSYDEYNQYLIKEKEKHPDANHPAWEALFYSYFQTYYEFKYDHEKTFDAKVEDEIKTYSVVCNGLGQIVFEYRNGVFYPVDEDLCTDDGIYFIPKDSSNIVVDGVNGLSYKEAVIDGDNKRYVDIAVTQKVTNKDGSVSIVVDERFERAKIRLNVYDHLIGTNPNSKIGLTEAEQIILSVDDDKQDDIVYDFALDYSLKKQSPSDYMVVNNSLIINSQLNIIAQDFYQYEKKYSPMEQYDYAIYQNLPENSKKILDDAIAYMHKIAEKDPNQKNQTFLPYLESYQQGFIACGSGNEFIIQMEYIFSAPMVSALIAENYKSELSENIEYLQKNANKSTKIKYQKKFEAVCSYYKYKIIKSIQEYMSYRISSGYNVVVNSQQFTLHQAMSSTQFMEIVFGNQLTYESLIGQLEVGSLYNDLTKFNQGAMFLLSSYIRQDLSELNQIIEKLKLYRFLNGAIYNILAYQVDFNLTARELEIINTFYEVQTGDALNVNSKMMFNYLKLATMNELGKPASYNSLMYDSILAELSKVADNLGYILDEFMAGSSDIHSTAGDITNLDATRMLARYIKNIKSDIELSYVDPDYTGIIDPSGLWGELRQFLKDFGRLCFDLETKSNFGSLTVGKSDSETIVGATSSYVNELLDMLNGMLAEVDFGSTGTSITKINNFSDLIAEYFNEENEQFEYRPVDGETKYENLTSEAKYYIAILCDYFEKATAEYNSIINNAKDAYNMVVKFKTGRYTIQPNSLIFTKYLKEYIEYFKYNVDSSDTSLQNDFAKNYIFDGYYLEVNPDLEFGNAGLSMADRLNYYFKYIESFDNFQFANSGNYYSDLTDLQQKVVDDCVKYYLAIYEDAQDQLEEKFAVANESFAKLTLFIFGDEHGNFSTISESGVDLIIANNIDILNLYNVLDFMGLEFDINKNLRDYRIDAINSLVDFREYSGESSASIQSRFLSLLYLACSDYTENNIGTSYIGYDDNSKQIILTLAGIQDQADEKLVNLEYEGNYSNSVADEKYGSIFIICTYNAETELYEPFIFASAPNKHNIPYSNYYQSINGQVTYYPIIAKGIFDRNGNPTAIREVNGYIEFYRDEVYRFSFNKMAMDIYAVAEEEIAENHGIVGNIVSTIKQTISRFLIADTVSDMISYIDVDLAPETYCGTFTKYEYHLEGGYCNLNYMFFNSTGIDVKHLYDISQLNIIILVIASVVILKAMWNILYGVVGSIYQIGILFAISPTVIGIYPMKSDAFKSWVKAFVKQFFIMYGYIVALNSYFIILSLIDQMGPLIDKLSPGSERILQDTFIFNGIDLFSIVSFLITTTLLLTATTMLSTMSEEFSINLFGGDNAESAGSKAKKQMESNLNEAEYFTSGYMLKDSVANELQQGVKTWAPLLPDISNYVQDKYHNKHNEKLAEKYKNDLLAQGVSATKAEEAKNAYKATLEARQKAKKDHIKAEEQRRENRQASLKSGGETWASKKKDDKVSCDQCGAKFPKSYVKGATHCPICRRKAKFK